MVEVARAPAAEDWAAEAELEAAQEVVTVEELEEMMGAVREAATRAAASLGEATQAGGREEATAAAMVASRAAVAQVAAVSGAAKAAAAAWVEEMVEAKAASLAAMAANP